jgi:nitroimidazol reductase NimA-like FMN-containing flavoprotein (pyridoxamine 5'-phosphate oxidase superfamily)
MEPLSTEEALELLRSAPVAHLGMVDGDVPYVTPMSFVIEPGGTLLFRTLPGRKLRVLQANPRVCIEASKYDESNGSWDSVIVTGTAREVDDAQLQSSVVALLFDKYETALGSPLGRSGSMQPLLGTPHVFQVDIDEITAWTSGRGFAARTKPGRL